MAPPQDLGPIRVDLVDLDADAELLPARDGYRTAWVVGCRAGVPQAIAEVDLTSATRPRLDELREAPAAPLWPGVAAVREEQLPAISVVVPTIVARVEELDRCLHSLRAADYPDVEVVLVDNRRAVPDHDPLPGLVAGHANVRVVREPRPGISAARNAGRAAARGEVVTFTDDDVRVDPGWLRALGRRFVAQPELDAVTGLILPAELDTAAQIWFERYYGGFSGERTFEPLALTVGTGPVGRGRVQARDGQGRLVRSFAIYGIGAYGAGANMAFRRSALDRIGDFDVALGTGTPARGGEDLAALVGVLWTGGSLGYEPAAVAHHTHRRSRPELLRQMRGNGVGYTAMLVSLLLHDPWHLVALGAQLPLAAQRLTATNARRLRVGRAPERRAGDEAAGRPYPRELVLEELRGLVDGPVAYLTSVLGSRRTGRRPGVV